jgi:hypothetical protein
MKNIILCDIDGTVANNDHRQHFLEGKKDWDGFFDALDKDKPIHKIIDKIIREHQNGKNIIFLTGRPERYRGSTLVWLEKFFDFNISMLMRKNNDQRNKLIIKMEIFESNFNNAEIDYVLDNDNELLEMWRDIGISTIDANEF